MHGIQNKRAWKSLVTAVSGAGMEIVELTDECKYVTFGYRLLFYTHSTDTDDLAALQCIGWMQNKRSARNNSDRVSSRTNVRRLRVCAPAGRQSRAVSERFAVVCVCLPANATRVGQEQ